MKFSKIFNKEFENHIENHELFFLKEKYRKFETIIRQKIVSQNMIPIEMFKKGFISIFMKIKVSYLILF